jgi:hypothetical protein
MPPRGCWRSRSAEALHCQARRRGSALRWWRLTLVAQDMSELAVDGRFGCIFVAFRPLQHLLTIDLQRRTRAAVQRHLAADGRLALHLFDPRLDLLIDGNLRPPTLFGVEPTTQRRYVGEVLRTSFDHVAQIRRDLWRYTEFDADGASLEQATREMSLRWTWRWELRPLLELCGFVVEADYSDFAGSAPSYGKELIVVAGVGRRKRNGRGRRVAEIRHDRFNGRSRPTQNSRFE